MFPVSIIGILYENNASLGILAMHQAALCNQPDMIEFLQRKEGLVNATDYHSSTPLHIACQKGHQSATVSRVI